MKNRAASTVVVASLALAATLSACGQGEPRSAAAPTGSAAAPTDAPAPSAPTAKELANATYRGVYGEEIRLADGHWEGEPFTKGAASRSSVRLIEDFRLVGDLDADGADEAAVLLWSRAGGSGTFAYLAVLGRRGNAVTNLATAELGDRVQVRAGRIENGLIELDVVQAGPGDAACCPTQKVTRGWRLGPEDLSELEPEVTGTISVADLVGIEWVLAELAHREPAPAEPEITVVFEEERVAGQSGCNRYFGSLQDQGDLPNSLVLGQIGSTRMACPDEIMKLENRYLRQLGGVTQYSFVGGKLALTWQGDGSAGVMLFTPRKTER